MRPLSSISYREARMMRSTHCTRVKAPNETSPTVDADASDYDDALPPNPLGRGIANGKANGKNQFGQGQLQIGVSNVRTLKAEFKQSELTYVFGKIGIDFLGIVIVHIDQKLKFSTLGQYKLITSTA